MICAIMQPTYLPWIGYFDLVDRVDKFVFLDDAKVSKQSWGVRNRIRTAQGELYLTVPLKNYRDHEARLFTNTEIDYGRGWTGKHLKTIAQAYAKAPHFAEVFADLEALLGESYPAIGDLNISAIRRFSERIGIATDFFRASRLAGTPGQKDGRLVAICRAVGASRYLSPQGSAVYIEKERPGGAFPEAGIALDYHNFAHPVYPQRGSDFLSHMAIVDLLMNCGYAAALGIIRSGRRDAIPFMEFRRTLAADAEPSPDICHADR